MAKSFGDQLEKGNNTRDDRAVSQRFILVLFVISLLGTYLLSTYSYLLFHSLAEMFSVSFGQINRFGFCGYQGLQLKTEGGL